MNFHRLHDTMTSLAVSAMLTSAILSTAPGGPMTAAAGPQPQALVNAVSALRTAGWQGMATVAAPEPAAAPKTVAITAAPADSSSKILSDAQVKKLMELDRSLGFYGPIDQSVTVALGVTTGNDVLSTYKLRYTDDNNPNDPPHVFAPLPNGEFIFWRINLHDAWLFRVDKDQDLIAAVIKPTGLPPRVMPVADAQKTIREELQAWAKAVGPVNVAKNP